MWFLEKNNIDQSLGRLTERKKDINYQYQELNRGYHHRFYRYYKKYYKQV